MAYRLPYPLGMDSPRTEQCPHCKEIIPEQGYHWGGFEWICATAASRAAQDDGEKLDYDEEEE